MSEIEENAVLVEEPQTKFGIGEELRLAREAKNLSLNNVAQHLKLGVNQIQAIEKENWQALPGRVFIIGFVRNYARFLDLDLKNLNERLPKEIFENQQNLEMKQGDVIVSATTTDKKAIVFALVVLLVAVLGYFFLPAELLQSFENWLSQTKSWNQKVDFEKNWESTVENPTVLPLDSPLPSPLSESLPEKLPMALPNIENAALPSSENKENKELEKTKNMERMESKTDQKSDKKAPLKQTHNHAK